KRHWPGGRSRISAPQCASDGMDMGGNIDGVTREINAEAGRQVAYSYQGDTTDEAFRASVFDSVSFQFDTVTMCVPAAGITRDDLVGAHRQDHWQGAHLSSGPVQTGPRRKPCGARLLGSRD